MLAFEMRMCSGVGWRNGRNSSVLDVLGLSGWSMEHRERKSRKQLDTRSAVLGERVRLGGHVLNRVHPGSA